MARGDHQEIEGRAEEEPEVEGRDSRNGVEIAGGVEVGAASAGDVVVVVGRSGDGQLDGHGSIKAVLPRSPNGDPAGGGRTSRDGPALGETA